MLTNRQLFQQYLAQTSDSPIALEIEKAEGIFLFSTDGKRYMDLISGISVSNTGHRHPRVVNAIKEQLDHYLHLMVYGEYVQAPQVLLAQQLASLLPPPLSHTYLVNSGSEAIEGALKLAKRFTGRKEIIAFTNAYHGSTQGALSVMGDDTLKKPFYPLLPGVRHLQINDFESLEQISNTTACVLIEPVQGEAGIIPATVSFLQALKQKCEDKGCLLIFDEVQTGFGRTGSMFAFMQSGVTPDILVLAKGMGGGLPIGAFISTKEIMSSLSHDPILGHITTFGGNPVCCAAALANIEVILEEKLCESVAEKAALFASLLRDQPGVQEIRKAGLMMAIQLDSFENVKRVINHTLEKGVILDWFLFNSNSVRIAPPLIITREEIEQACTIISEALHQTYGS